MMATNAFGTAWRSFWHTMTSNDRHASHDSPYRSGRHVPLSQSRHEPLSSIATSAIESRPDLTDPYDEALARGSVSPNVNGRAGSPDGVGSPVSRPYSPGMRSLSSQMRRSNEHAAAPPEIQMQSFHDGAPPPPPIAHSWKKIERWLESNYEELLDNLCEGCTQNDINELEHDLDCSLPLEIRESLMVHDGQERPGLPTGVLFGCMLLDCEEIVQEWKNWKVVNEEYLSGAAAMRPDQPPKASSSAATAAAAAAGEHGGPGPNPLWRQDLLERQDSQPPGAVQRAYAHPSWIPLARDWGGNNIAVDLAPGPAGKWGQIIIFGRDYDCKYVVARSWAAFMAMFADDICSGKVHVDEETSEFKLNFFKSQNVNPPYLEILRWRTDQRHGRRPPPRRAARPQSGLGLNAAHATSNRSSRDSPYGSPAPSEERGRSPHRFANRGNNQSPKTQFAVSSPLARVTEEISSPVKETSSVGLMPGDSKQSVKTTPDAAAAAAATATATATADNDDDDDLIQVVTPRIPVGSDGPPEPADTTESSAPAKTGEDASEQTAKQKDRSSKALDPEVLGEMKNVAI